MTLAAALCLFAGGLLIGWAWGSGSHDGGLFS